MDRPSVGYGYVAAVLVKTAMAAAALTAGGCQSVWFTAAYILKGHSIEAEYDGLKDKKVVVVCRPVVDLTYRDSHVAKDLAKELGNLLRENVAKIEVVKQQQVHEWIDENTWQQYSEVGEAFDADMVVGVELQGFTIMQGQTLYQGRANVVLRVYDRNDPDEPVFECVLPETVYPRDGGIAAYEKPQREFRRRFVHILADQIGRNFYPHDPHADYALDATTLD